MVYTNNISTLPTGRNKWEFNQPIFNFYFWKTNIKKYTSSLAKQTKIELTEMIQIWSCKWLNVFFSIPLLGHKSLYWEL